MNSRNTFWIVLLVLIVAGALYVVQKQSELKSARSTAPANGEKPAVSQTPTASVQPTAPAPAPTPAPVSVPDATITNAPSLAGSVILDLPALKEGEVRSIANNDGSFLIDEKGDLVRGFASIPAATKRIVDVTTKAGDADQKSAFTIAVEPAAWTLEAFPEMIVVSYTQENVKTPGPVSEISCGGIMGMVSDKMGAKAAGGGEPVKQANGNGIEFAADSGQCLSFKTDGDALLTYRWTLAIIRIDESSSSGKVATILRVNDGPQGNGRSGNWLPRIDYNRSDRSISAFYRGTKKHELKSPADSVAADGRWNVVLTYRRHGRLFLRVNGKDCGEQSPTDSFCTEHPDDLIESRIGDKARSAPGWALDGLWIGQSELSERVAEKMEAWALQRAALLPGGAAAKPAFAPVIDEEDFPHRYCFDYQRWAAWKQANPKEKRLAYMGQPVAKVQPDRSDWVRVFYDDFRKPAQTSDRALDGSSIGDSTYDTDVGKQAWYAPGWNPAIGGYAKPKDGNDRPYKDVYLHDPANKTMTMRVYCSQPAKDGKPAYWKNAQCSTVNETGQGYSWAGPKGFRIRAKMINVGPESFYAPLWFYGLEHMFWRTTERVEFDIIELDDNWDNYGSSHVHHGRFPGLFGHSKYDTMKKKSVPKEIASPKHNAGEKVCGIDAWDGKYHTWEVWIEEDFTYINADGVEIARVDTTQEYLERLYVYMNTCIKSDKGMNPALKYDMVVDSIEGFQPASVVDATPGKPFTARPTLAGTPAAGQTITCAANVSGCEDVWYYWHSDGYPRGFGLSNTYTVLPEDAGAEIRCMVKAVGAKDQPEAWTAPLRIR